MTIWNIDAWKGQKYISLAVSCYFMSISDKVFHIPDSIMLLSPIIAIMISTAKIEKITSLSPLKTFLKANSTETCITLHPRVMQ